MLPRAVAVIVATAALLLAQPADAQDTRRTRELCSGHVQEQHFHQFTAEEEDHCTSDIRGKALDVQTVLSECKPREVMVELNTDAYHQYEPSVVVVKRCTGYCTNAACTAIATAPRKIQVTRKSLLDKRFKCGVVEVLDHTECGCDCKLRPENCRKPKVYNKMSCRCVCANSDAKKSGCDKGYWDDDACDCVCPREECPEGHEWVAHRCRCVRTYEW